MADSIPSINRTKTSQAANLNKRQQKSGVEFTHPDYDKHLKRWCLIEDVLEGEDKVKAEGEVYLPRNNPNDTSEQAAARYINFKERAVFYNFSNRTLSTLIGIAFKKDPTLKVPTSLEYVEDDIDGAGVSIYQQSQKVFSNVLSKGRSGLLVDYPSTGGSVSKFDQESGMVKAVCVHYPEKEIINWRTVKVGAKIKTGMVVLHETREVLSSDGFSFDCEDIYRVLILGTVVKTEEGLMLDDGTNVDAIDAYYQLIYSKADGANTFDIEEVIIPRDSAGNTFDEIPFFFVGSENNDINVDCEPFYDLAALNIAHYRNSASYENSVFWCGEPQPTVTGLTQSWVDNNLNEFVIGSAALLPLPENADFKYVQVAPNTMVADAMKQKIELAASMGARLLEKGSAPKTATEASSDEQAETSIAGMVAVNVSEAYTLVLQAMLKFNGGGEGEVEYEINRDYINREINPQLLTAIMDGVIKGKIPESDFWQYLRKYGLVAEDKDDDSIKDELENAIGGSMNLDDMGGFGEIRQSGQQEKVIP